MARDYDLNDGGLFRRTPRSCGMRHASWGVDVMALRMTHDANLRFLTEQKRLHLELLDDTLR